MVIICDATIALDYQPSFVAAIHVWKQNCFERVVVHACCKQMKLTAVVRYKQGTVAKYVV